MFCSSRQRHILVGAASVQLILFFFALPATAQPPAFVIPPDPQAPTISLPNPLGASPGTTVEVTLTGTNLNDPVSLVTDFPAKVGFPIDANNTKDAAKLRAKIEVPPNTPVGSYSLRLVTKQGVSNFRPFCIDDLPTAPSGTGNRSKSTALSIPVPCVVAGRVDGETSDFYRITVKPGQRLTFEVLARRLGSSLDPIILMHDAKTGREIPSLYSDDAPGLQTDARFGHTFKEGGEFLVEVRDSTHRGGPDFWYRLRIGDFPSAITPFPLAAQRGSKAVVQFAGPDVDGVSPVSLATPATPGLEAISVVPKGARPFSGWPVSLLLTDSPEIVEQEPNNEPAKANRVPVPCGISGRFLEKSDLDCYVFAAKKGQRYLINSQTHELLSPAEVYMTLKDAKGAEVAKSNPQTGAGIDFTAPAEGDYTLVAEHLNYAFGPNEVYRITITQPAAHFELALSTDRLNIPTGGTTVIPIQSLVRSDYAGPIEISVVDNPNLSGSIVITTAAAPAPNLPVALLPVTHKASGKPETNQFRVQAKATVNGKEIRTFANVQGIVHQNFGNLPFPPREYFHIVHDAITEPPFRLEAKFTPADGVRTLPAALKVTATRTAGFAEDIGLTVLGLPPNVTAAAKPIAKGTNEIQFPLTAAANVPLGPVSVVISGKAKFQNRDFTVPVAATLNLVLPFELKVDAPQPLKPGDKVRFKVTATRKAGYNGPIDLEVKNLPANVTAPKVQIPMGKNDVEIEVTAAANAAAGDKADVNVTGTAAGQPVPSANFAVKVIVVKK
ncbi:MAG TPA: hypothetical protein VKS79_26575 [Gemmataceae bacterium]|nr:hypothetical protein [Gemmataceae bacterium]